MSKPDFEALRAQRDAGIQAVARAMAEKLGADPGDEVTFHARDFRSPCYCACPDGPCEHHFQGWQDITDEDGQACGGEQVCSRCGEGAMSHSVRVGP